MSHLTGFVTTVGTIAGALASQGNVILSASVGGTAAFFVGMFWKYQFSNLDERIEIQRKLKAMIPLIKMKHDLKKRIDNIKRKKK